MLVCFIFVILMISACSSNSNELKAQKLIDYQKVKYDDALASGKLVDGVREIDVTATRYFWDPREIIVNEGERVRLNVATVDTPHGFEIEGFNIPGYDINTKIEKGKPISVEFDADRQGSWEVICTVYCGAGHGSMKAKFIIR
jgi:heme/copper-type cytochrome/quinol oxidase subunit 2